MKIPVNIRISKYTSNTRPDGVKLSIEDKISGSIFIECDISMMAFAQMLTGSGGDAVGEFLGVHIGMVHEVKTEVVEVSGKGKSYGDEGPARKAIAPFEVDGWRGSVSGAMNHHRHTGGNKYSVGFSRFVPLTPENAEGLIAKLTKYGWSWPDGYTSDDLRNLATTESTNGA